MIYRLKWLPLLLVVLTFSPSYADDEMIKSFSINKKDGKVIFTKNGKKIGHVERPVKGKR